jgi:hypothetical protein
VLQLPELELIHSSWNVKDGTLVRGSQVLDRDAIQLTQT